jgi:uncharacterized delta-60 repeat protein
MKGRDFALAVCDANGHIDPAFGDGGRVMFDIGSQWSRDLRSEDEAHAVAFAADGSLLVTGSTSGVSYTRLVLVRFSPNGEVDPAFGAVGVTMAGSDFYGRGRTIALQPDGKILVGGKTGRYPARDGFPKIRNGHQADFVVARFRIDGTLDSGFGDGGMTRTDLGEEDEVEGLASLPDGSILAVGHGTMGTTGLKTTLVLMRHRPQ